jgi:hypothetical protein
MIVQLWRRRDSVDGIKAQNLPRLEGARHASSFTLQRESMQRRKSISSRVGRDSCHKHPLGHAPQLSIRTSVHEPEAARGAPP